MLTSPASAMSAATRHMVRPGRLLALAGRVALRNLPRATASALRHQRAMWAAAGAPRRPRLTCMLSASRSVFAADRRPWARQEPRLGARRSLATSALPSHRIIDLPAMSPTMSVGNVGTWKKKPGDKITAGDVLVEIETDKATMDFECQEEGYLAKILIDSGSKDVAVGKPLAILVEDAADVAAFENYSAASSSSNPPAPSASSAPPAAAAASTGVDKSTFPPHNVIGLPAMSPTMESGNVGQWKKKEGDKVNAGDVLVEVETDKAQMDFECQDEGYLAKILVPANTKDVKVGQPLAVLVEDPADVPKFGTYVAAGAPAAEAKPAGGPAAPPMAKPSPSSAPPSATVPARTTPATGIPSPSRSPSDRIKASPLAKTLAREKGIPLDQLLGRGPNGRIVKLDVETYVPPAKPAVEGGALAFAKRAPRVRPAEPFTDLPLSNMRRVIAKRLTESKSTIPHFYLTMEIEMDRILKVREILNAQAGDQYKLSVNDFVVKAAALALRDVPEVNAGWNEDSVRQYNTVDISIAVAIDAGLITPIVTDADSKGIAAISNDIKDLAARAKKGKLAPHEYQGGSFSISNLGMYGINHFTAIINPPQAAILAVGGTSQKVVPDDDSKSGFKAVSVMQVTMSCDHRVVDGAVGAKWLQVFKKNLEQPIALVL